MAWIKNLFFSMCTGQTLICIHQEGVSLGEIADFFESYGPLLELTRMHNSAKTTMITYKNKEDASHVIKEYEKSLARKSQKCTPETKERQNADLMVELDKPRDQMIEPAKEDYRQVKDEEGRRIMTLIPHHLEEQHVFEDFRQFGKIEYMNMITTTNGGRNAFICFERKESAEKAVTEARIYGPKLVGPQILTKYKGELKRIHDYCGKIVNGRNLRDHIKYCKVQNDPIGRQSYNDRPGTSGTKIRKTNETSSNQDSLTSKRPKHNETDDSDNASSTPSEYKDLDNNRDAEEANSINEEPEEKEKLCLFKITRNGKKYILTSDETGKVELAEEEEEN